jgi:hypothetical protein
MKQRVAIGVFLFACLVLRQLGPIRKRILAKRQSRVPLKDRVSGPEGR